MLTFTTDNGVFSKHAVDFGSKLLIDTFAEPEIPGAILDIGCGYGPIGITLSKSFPERRVVMTDINERAVGLAAENAAANHAKVDVFVSDLFEKTDGTFAAIVTNPPIRAGKKVVYRLFAESFDHLDRGGSFWTVIQKKQGAPSARKALDALYGSVEVRARAKGYSVFYAKKN